MMRKLTLLLLLAAIPAALHAQVATTDLVPGASRFVHPGAFGFNSATYTPDNPAALTWDEMSRFGGGLIQGAFKDKITGTSFDYDGKFLGFRIIGETFNGAGEIQDASDDQGVVFTEDTTNAQLSIKVSDAFSLGVGTDSTSSGNNDLDRLTLGASFKLGDALYFGAAIFDDDLNLGGVSGTRDGTMLGVAYRSEGDSGVYIAYDIIEWDETVVAGVGQADGVKFSTATLQVRFGSLMFGGSLLDLSGPGIGNDISATTLDAGWMQDAELSVSGRITVLSETDAAGTTDDEVTTQSVNMTWMF